jgi:hypothetical protein
VTDQTGIALYVACLALGAVTLVIILVTGAFFSRGVGVALSSWGALLSLGIVGTALIAPSGSGWLTIPGILLLVFFGFLFTASLGGEK